jgi:hypothetical protein
MPFTTYSELQTVVASRLHRDDLTTEIQDSIKLAEAEMQVECKLVEFESTGSISVTAGVGTLPTDFVGMRSIYWDGDTTRELVYLPPAQFDILRNTNGLSTYYTISGTTIRTIPSQTGTAVITYNARFTPLSVANPSNSLLTNHPDAYLYGTLKHIAIHTEDDTSLQKSGTMFNAAKERITKNNQERKYAGPLTVKAR